MKTIKQILRQPIRTAAGILVIALAFAILVTCVGQYAATVLTRKNLDDRYTTIALLTEKAFYGVSKFSEKVMRLSYVPEETQQWIDNAKATHPEIFKTTTSTGLISAYIPQLSIDNFSRYEDGYSMGKYNYGYPYRSAMLTVTLTQIGTVGAVNTYSEENVNIQYVVAGDYVANVTYLCVGTIEEEVGLEKGYAPMLGKTIVLHVTVPDEEAFGALDLQVGETYLVYGENFNAGDRLDFILGINFNKNSYEQLFGKLHYKPGVNIIDYDEMLAQFDCVMTVCDPATLTAWLPAYDEQGNQIGMERSDLLEVHYWEGEKLKRKWIPYEEYAPNYQLPAIAPLTGSVDEFLASEEGALWQEALQKMEINNHAFPVLCVDKLGYQAAFSRELARIVEGRDFTESELANGEKVCIISQTVATRSGLTVGDTIDLRAYDYDFNYALHRRDWELGGEFPFAAKYSEALGFASEAEIYTIVGLYRQEDAWDNRYDPYGFTPNTVFVPKSSVAAPMQIRNKGLYTTMVLQNGKMDDFQALLEADGHSDWFVCYDQGYSEVETSMNAYEAVSRKALYIGLAGFSAVVLLFLLLYPAREKRALHLMGSLGTSRFARFGHTFVGTLCVLIPGAVIGAVVGVQLWQRIAAELMEWINVTVTLDADMTKVAPKVTVIGTGVTAVLALVISIAMSGTRKLMKRK